LKVELKTEKRTLKELFVNVAGFSLFSLVGLFYSSGKVRSQLAKIRLAEQKSQKARQELQNIIDTVRDPLLILDGNLRVKGASRSFYDTFSLFPEDTENKFLYELGGRE
jgi:PAS domain-containing protein